MIRKLVFCFGKFSFRVILPIIKITGDILLHFNRGMRSGGLGKYKQNANVYDNDYDLPIQVEAKQITASKAGTFGVTGLIYNTALSVKIAA